jgi:cell division protein FtsL
MTRLALIALLFALASLAQAGTFELSDPANEMLKEEQQSDLPSQKLNFEWSGNMLCSVDTSTGACSCIDKKAAKKLSMTQQECASRVLEALRVNNSR